MTLEIQVLAWERHKNVAGFNWLMGSQPSPLDNWIFNSNTHLQTIKYLKRFAFTQKDQTLTKINDNINIDSTIAGPVNDNINIDSTIAGPVNAHS